MKIYKSNSLLGFGKYLGKTIRDVIEIDPQYISWCLDNLDHFQLSPAAKVLLEANGGKPKKWGSSYARKLPDETFKVKGFPKRYYDRNDPMEGYGTSGEKYGWYNGWSDDAIDDAFEGDPENTWNVD